MRSEFSPRAALRILVTNVLIVLTLPQAVRMQYFDHVKRHFPEVKLDMVDHHTKVDPTIAEAAVGQASQEMKDEFAFVLEAQKFTLDRMKPGAKCSEIFAEYNAFMRKNKRPEEKRLHSHGQGYDMVERPLIRHDETMTIQKNMNMVCHPTYVTAGTYSWCCDNFLIGETGVAEKLHKFPQKIVELG